VWVTLVEVVIEALYIPQFVMIAIEISDYLTDNAFVEAFLYEKKN
jgi:hypothetical protein